MARLAIDPLLEGSTNTPVELWDSQDGSIGGVDSMNFPSPQQDLATAGSINTEGDRVTARRHGNRQGTITVDVIEPAGLGLAINGLTNPAPGPAVTGWNSDVSGGGTMNTFAVEEPPDQSSDYAIHYVGTQPADTTLRGYGIMSDARTVTAGSSYTFGCDIFTPSLYESFGATYGDRLEILWYSDAGATVLIGTSSGGEQDDTGYVAVWRRLTVTDTAPVSAIRAKARVRKITNSSGDVVGAYYRRFCFSTDATYFDGDTPGCAWAGTPHASQSTRTASGGPRFRAIIADLQAKAAKVAQSGGTLRWVNDDAEEFTLDLLSGEGLEVPLDIKYFSANSASCTFTFTALPYWRRDEVTLTQHSETTLPVLIFTETSIQGDVPALARLVIDVTGVSQRVVRWGIQSRYYDATATSDLFLQAENATATNATAGAQSGASGTAMRNTALTTSWAYQFQFVDKTWLGQFRVLARMQVPAANTGVVSARLSSTGAGEDLYTHPAVTLDTAYADSWVVHDLGYISIAPPSRGVKQTSLWVEAISTVSGDDAYFDWLLLLPCAEGAGEARAVGLGTTLSTAGSLQIASHDVLRGATVWSAPDIYEGDYLFLPPTTPAAPTLRVVVKASRGATGDTPVDSGIDDVDGQIFYTPRYLNIR